MAPTSSTQSHLGRLVAHPISEMLAISYLSYADCLPHPDLGLHNTEILAHSRGDGSSCVAVRRYKSVSVNTEYGCHVLTTVRQARTKFRNSSLFRKTREARTSLKRDADVDIASPATVYAHCAASAPHVSPRNLSTGVSEFDC